MRELDAHKVNGANEKLKISVLDDAGAGGACHLYMIEGFDTSSNASDPFVARHGGPARHATVLFQNGPIPEVGVNGVTHEALLTIVKDRLESFQDGPYACFENGMALDGVNAALKALKKRTERRIERGVEGTHTV